MRMCLIATVHHGSAVYIINGLHSLLYPTMTSAWLQDLHFHSPVYNTLEMRLQVIYTPGLLDANSVCDSGLATSSIASVILFTET